jgi:hypothetical protein
MVARVLACEVVVTPVQCQLLWLLLHSPVLLLHPPLLLVILV